MRRIVALGGAMLLLGGTAAQAQSVEDKLRDALRHALVDLRAAQDSQATLQAQLDAAQKQRDAFQAQAAQLTAQLAQQPQAPAAPAGPSPEMQAELQQLHDALAALKQQNAALQDGLAKWQTAYQKAAGIAQAKDLLSRQLGTKLATAQGTLGVCQAKNTKLIAVANDILHLYRTPHFRAVLRGSWEPLLGYKEVELQNIVQDNEDRILDQRYYAGEQPPAAKPAAH